MGDTAVTIQVIGLEKALRSLSKTQKEAWDLKKPFQHIIIYLQARFDKTFKKGGERPWKANSPATIAIKGSSKPLIDSRLLQGSLTGKAKGSHHRATKRRLEFGTTVKYAAAQDKGVSSITVSPAFRRYAAIRYGVVLPLTVSIPPRPFMFFTKQDIKAIKKILELYFNTTIKLNTVGV